MLARNSAARSGWLRTPRSGPGSCPAKKLSPVRRTPAVSMAVTKASISAWGGVAVSQGHQNSTAWNPASRAAWGRSFTGSSVNSREQLTVWPRVWVMVLDSVDFTNRHVHFTSRITPSVRRSTRACQARDDDPPPPAPRKGSPPDTAHPSRPPQKEAISTVLHRKTQIRQFLSEILLLVLTR